MFALSSATRVYLRSGASNMRKSFNSLYALAEQQLVPDSLSTSLDLTAKTPEATKTVSKRIAA